jgi:hypothetical protein
MRFPRINRIRWDKPAGEADTLATLEGMLEAIETGRPGSKGSMADGQGARSAP